MKVTYSVIAGLLASSSLLMAAGVTPAQSTAGGTAVVAMAPQTEPNWFFPVVSGAGYSAINFQVNALMYLPLIAVSKKDTVNYAQSLASAITVNKTDTQFVIHLSHRYRWSNGQPVTAQDVVFTWDLIKAACGPHSPLPYGDAQSGGVPSDFKSVTATNADTVVVTLNTSVNPSWFILNGLSQISPVPKAVWDRYPTNMHKELQFIVSESNNPTYKGYAVVDGAFKFLSYQPNGSWTFVPNQTFGGHKASISRLILEYETSETSEFAQLEEGTVNVGYLPLDMIADKGRLKNDQITETYLSGMNFVNPDFQAGEPDGAGAFLNQAYIREAMEMGIDQPGIIKTLFHGYGIPTDGPITAQPPTVYYDKALAKMVYPYDPAKGKKLLEAHGWHMKNGVMVKGTQSLKMSLLYSSGSTLETSLVQLLKADWAREGIDVSLVSQPLGELFTTMGTDHWDLAYWNSGYTYQLDYYPTAGSFFLPGGGENGGHYANSTMTKLVLAYRQGGTPAQEQQRLDAYEVYAAKTVPLLWMPWVPQGYARVPGLNVTAKNIKGPVSDFNPVTDFLNANYWTIR
ncbi:MAG: ABC transporter substrate-binding protein [Sulfobacillus acidophilus]|uniref:ABC transporter substrate-binding protein n=1 Tax=Sulfobacillus acidophilus TaxID=53633 RepID=A0A2T2WGU3_9FIRM|nr:MAG: ABC transporter substrate-binding protein [Sulfobacillus acidophilus]